MRDDVQPDHEEHDGGERTDAAHGGARDAVVDAVDILLAPLAQQQGNRGCSAEEQQLLAHRVEAAVVEHDGGDRVHHVPLLRCELRDQVAVRPGIVAERRQVDDAVHEQRAEAERPEREDDEADARAHLRFLCAATRAIALTSTSG